jgi:hypothetical protein
MVWLRHAVQSLITASASISIGHSGFTNRSMAMIVSERMP